MQVAAAQVQGLPRGFVRHDGHAHTELELPSSGLSHAMGLCGITCAHSVTEVRDLRVQAPGLWRQTKRQTKLYDREK